MTDNTPTPAAVIAPVPVSAPASVIAGPDPQSMPPVPEDDEISLLDLLQVVADNLRLLDSTPHINQRKLAESLGVSLGKTNFCLNALLDKGLVKMENFRTSTRKLNYAYLLTPSGVTAKAALTQRILKRKMEEYEALKIEIEQLKQEAADN